MKCKSWSCSEYKRVAGRLLLACVCLVLSSAGAQLRNPSFESPLDPWDPTGLTGGRTNWVIVYESGGPGDFAMHDRSTESAHGSAGHGVHLRPSTEWWCHAYFTQTVTNLVQNGSYVLTGWINKDYINAKDHTYIELIGGSGGTTSVVSPDVSAVDWIQYSVTNTASSTGTLIIRLHESKQQMPLSLPGLAKYLSCNSRFDEFTLTLQ
jgi:hypothetical protein